MRAVAMVLAAVLLSGPAVSAFAMSRPIQGLGVVVLGASEADMVSAGFVRDNSVGGNSWCPKAAYQLEFSGSARVYGEVRPARYVVCTLGGKVAAISVTWPHSAFGDDSDITYAAYKNLVQSVENTYGISMEMVQLLQYAGLDSAGTSVWVVLWDDSSLNLQIINSVVRAMLKEEKAGTDMH